MKKRWIAGLVVGTTILGVVGLWGINSIRFGFPIGLSSTKKPYQIASASMIPTMLPGDFVIAEKLREHETNEPIQSGDLVVFYNEKQEYEQIGRVIAKGGDSVRLIEGMVFVNGEPLPQVEIRHFEFAHDPGTVGVLKQETLGQNTYEIVDIYIGFGRLDNVGPYYVPDDYFFVLGDNRDRSLDSRVISDVGYVPAKNITHKLTRILKSELEPERAGRRLD